MTCNHPPLPPYRCSYRFWSSGSPSRARAARQQPYSPTAPPSHPSTSTGPRSQTPPPRPRPWPNLTPMTFTRSPGLSLRVGVSTRVHRATGRRRLSVSTSGWVNRRRRSRGRWWREVVEVRGVSSLLLYVFRKAALLKSVLTVACGGEWRVGEQKVRRSTLWSHDLDL